MDHTQSYAFLIGVGKRNEDAAGMAISADDAENTSLAIKEYCRIPDDRITLLTNEQAGKSAIVNGLEKLVQKTQQQPADTIIIYFSGHGCNVNGELYLLGNDALNAQIPQTAISGNEWTNLLDQLQAKKVLVILDCCHAGAITQANKHIWKPADIPFDKDSFLNKKNRVVLTACHASQVSYLSKPVSIFTYALIEGLSGSFLQKGDKNVTIFDLAMYTRERVVFLSRQINKNEPQKPEINVWQQSSTENFYIARFPKGEGKPYPFKTPFNALESETDGKAIQLADGIETDNAYRIQVQQLLQVNVANVQGNDNVVMQGSGLQNNNNQNNNTIIINVPGNANNGGQQGNTIPVNSKKEEILFEDYELKKLSNVSDFNEGLIHIKKNDTVYLRLPNTTQAFTYKLKSEKFSGRIIHLLQRISLEDILRENEYELLGMSLFNRLFSSDEARKAAVDFFNQMANIQNDKIRFVFQFDLDSLDTASIPWEYLFFQPVDENPGFFFGKKFKITRRLENILGSPLGEQALSELQVLFAASAHLKGKGTEIIFDTVARKVKNAYQDKVKMELVFAENFTQIKEIISKKKFHLIHLIGMAKAEPIPNGNALYSFGFAEQKDDEIICNEWKSSDELMGAFMMNCPVFVFLHACRLPVADPFSEQQEQSFIAMSGIAFQLARLVPGVLALQTAFDSPYTISFLKQFYEDVLTGMVLYEAVDKALKLLTKNGLENTKLPLNRVLGMSAVFSDLTSKIRLLEYAPQEEKPTSVQCPNWYVDREDIKRTRIDCDRSIPLKADGTPAIYSCSKCRKRVGSCANCHSIIGQDDIDEGRCSICGKNPASTSTQNSLAAPGLDALPNVGDKREGIQTESLKRESRSSLSPFDTRFRR